MNTPITKDQVFNLYDQYLTGRSTRDLAASAGVSRQALAQKFQQYGLKMRAPNKRPFILFQGKKYTQMTNKACYRNTRPPFDMLHRAIWTNAHGPIPESTKIYFKNGNPQDHSLKNLVAIAGRTTDGI